MQIWLQYGIMNQPQQIIGVKIPNQIICCVCRNVEIHFGDLSFFLSITFNSKNESFPDCVPIRTLYLIMILLCAGEGEMMTPKTFRKPGARRRLPHRICRILHPYFRCVRVCAHVQSLCSAPSLSLCHPVTSITAFPFSAGPSVLGPQCVRSFTLEFGTSYVVPKIRTQIEIILFYG